MPTVSASWKASLPIMKVGTCPVRTTIGIESISASVMPVTALVAPGPGGDQNHPGPAGRAGIALGGMRRGLLVAHQDVADVVLLEDRVVDRQHRAAGIAEHGVDPLVLQSLNDHFCAGHVSVHRASPILRVRRVAAACAPRPAIKKPPLGGSWRGASGRALGPFPGSAPRHDAYRPVHTASLIGTGAAKVNRSRCRKLPAGRLSRFFSTRQRIVAPSRASAPCRTSPNHIEPRRSAAPADAGDRVLLFRRRGDDRLRRGEVAATNAAGNVRARPHEGAAAPRRRDRWRQPLLRPSRRGSCCWRCLISAGNATSRYLFSVSSNAWLEIQWQMFAGIFLLGGANVLRLNEHVRVDLLYGARPPRGKLWTDVIGLMLFLIPSMLTMIFFSWEFFMTSFLSGEHSSNAGGLLLWPVKLLLPFGLSLLLLQGIAELIKRIAGAARRPRRDDRLREADPVSRAEARAHARLRPDGADDVRRAGRSSCSSAFRPPSRCRRSGSSSACWRSRSAISGRSSCRRCRTAPSASCRTTCCSPSRSSPSWARCSSAAASPRTCSRAWASSSVRCRAGSPTR